MLWQIILDAEGYDLKDEEQVHIAFLQRKNATDLKAGIRRVIEGQKGAHSGQFAAILTEVERDMDFRHMAVHGAWWMNEDGTFSCEWFKNSGTKKSPRWMINSKAFDYQQLDYALEAVDRLLGDTIKLWSALNGARSPFEHGKF